MECKVKKEIINDRKSDGRRPERLRKYVPAGELFDRHHQVNRLIVQGMTNVQIAREMNMSEQSVCQIRNAPLTRAHVRQLHEEADKAAIDVRRQINEMAPKCLEIIDQIITNDEVSASLRMQGAFKCLGIAGYVEPKNVNVKAIHGMVDTKTLDMIKERAESLKQAGSLRIDD
jgi:hypothetical protein